MNRLNQKISSPAWVEKHPPAGLDLLKVAAETQALPSSGLSGLSRGRGTNLGV
jgi:hypothetical protein